jgi:hypothetical protein
MPGLSRVLEVNSFGEVDNTYEILTLSLEGPLGECVAYATLTLGYSVRTGKRIRAAGRVELSRDYGGDGAYFMCPDEVTLSSLGVPGTRSRQDHLTEAIGFLSRALTKELHKNGIYNIAVSHLDIKRRREEKG